MNETNFVEVDIRDANFVQIDALDGAAELAAEAVCACGCGMCICCQTLD
jgi:hypothetical protein